MRLVDTEVLGSRPSRRLRILYAAPGSCLSTTFGSARNVLSVAQELAERADVTVAFRRIVDAPGDGPCRVLSIEAEDSGSLADEAGAQPIRGGLWGHLRYLRRLRQFAAATATDFDVVIEKGWRLSGWLVASYWAQGVPGVLSLGIVRQWSEPVRTLRDLARRTAFPAERAVVRRHLRRAPAIIAETACLRDMLAAKWRVPAERIEVMSPGVDHQLFRPLPAEEARAALSIAEEATVLLYVGSFDKYHDLAPLLRALVGLGRSDLQLHLVGGDAVGDRAHRRLYENMVPAGALVHFHGRVPHREVPRLIAAADLCTAPYDVRAFPYAKVTFGTLKIPEYMACGRPVASVPSGSLRDLIADGVTGFLRPNDAESWAALLSDLPPRAQLREMGRAARRSVADVSWENTAAGYLRVCESLVDGRAVNETEVSVEREVAS